MSEPTKASRPFLFSIVDIVGPAKRLPRKDNRRPRIRTPDQIARMKIRRRLRYKLETEFRAACIAEARQSRQNNPHKWRAYRAARKARERKQMHPLANMEKIASIYQLAVIETKRTEVPHDVDHIIPLIGGGFHHEENLQVIPKSVNQEKHGNLLWRSTQYLDWTCVPMFLWPIGWAKVVCA